MATGKKTGGRQVGSKNKASRKRDKELAVAASGLTPLDYMLTTMRDEGQPVNVRLSAAKDAAQYVHPKLSAIEHSGEIDHHVHDDARTVIAGLLSELAGGGAPPTA